jgi:di/tricarboxylate transporter
MVLLAMMLISAALSAFMSNTATASLMCPLASSLYEEMKEVTSERQEISCWGWGLLQLSL